MSDPANEGLQENNQCPPPGSTTFRKYGVYKKSGTSDWFTHTCHADTVAYLQSGCTQILPEIPGISEATYGPTARPAHAKDYTSNGRKRFFIHTGTNPDHSKYIRVSRND